MVGLRSEEYLFLFASSVTLKKYSFERSLALSARTGLSTLSVSTPVPRLHLIVTTYFISQGYAM
jgi:hypothetical protein